MKVVFAIIVCLSLFTREIKSFEFIRNMIFPRTPEVNRVRHIEDASEDPFAVLDTVGLIEQHGYPAEQHELTTDDGYIIVFFRLPGSPLSPTKIGKPVVFLQHGVVASSDNWVLIGPGYDLAFLLADAGYDVWLANSRGNTYCRSHKTLSSSDKDFWDFSFHEMSILDLPKLIDYALVNSGQKTLIYIGNSMGTTMSYILLSEKPDYNEKIRLVVSLGPVAFWKEKLNIVYRTLVNNVDLIRKLCDSAEIYDWLPQTKSLIKLARDLCSDDSATQILCKLAWFVLAGQDDKQFNSTLLPYILSYYPAGSSTKTFHHLGQNMAIGVLQKFDYGPTENFARYGSEKAPSYNLSKMTAPCALFYGKNDALAAEKNSKELAKHLRNVVVFEAVPYSDFNHIDFLWAINAKELLYDRVIEIISMYGK